METTKEYLIDLLKEKYEYELQRRKYFDEALSIPVTILSLLIAGIYLTIDDKSLEFTYVYLTTLKWCLIILLSFGCFILIFFLFKVYFGYQRRYCTFPDSNTIVTVDLEAIKKYHENASESEMDNLVKSDLKDHVIKWYLDCNTSNTAVNDLRMDMFFYSRICIGICLSIGVLLLILVGAIKSI